MRSASPSSPFFRVQFCIDIVHLHIIDAALRCITCTYAFTFTPTANFNHFYFPIHSHSARDHSYICGCAFIVLVCNEPGPTVDPHSVRRVVTPYKLNNRRGSVSAPSLQQGQGLLVYTTLTLITPGRGGGNRSYGRCPASPAHPPLLHLPSSALTHHPPNFPVQPFYSQRRPIPEAALTTATRSKPRQHTT